MAKQDNNKAKIIGQIDLSQQKNRKTPQQNQTRNRNPASHFHNPYHFVPVLNGVNGKWSKKENLTSGRKSHCSYTEKEGTTGSDADVFHGRIICKLTTKTPIFIGDRRANEATKDKAAEILPFTLDDKPAIPASSLRGVISSLAEAASSSSFRVLNDATLSCRRTVRDCLSALGEIQKSGDGRFSLRPLTLPNIEAAWGTDFQAPLEFRTKAFPDNEPPRFKILVGDYKKNKNSVQINGKDVNFRHLASRSSEFFYLQATPSTWEMVNKDRVQKNRKHFKFKSVNEEKKDILLYSYSKNAEFVTHEKRKDGHTYIRGRFKIMGGPKRGLPKTVKYEVFIPYPEKDVWTGYELKIPPKIISRFEQLSDQCTATQDNEKTLHVHKLLPYHPLATARNEDKKKHGRRLRLKTGDIVYFRPTPDGDKVEEISFSSIWRKRAGGTVHEYFSSIFEKPEDGEPDHGKEILPFHPKREWISPAELLFGFVENRSGQHKGRHSGQALSYAGRVNFSFGLPGPEDNEDPFHGEKILLQILTSPKPPCPSLYFTPKNGPGFIPKTKLQPEKHRPQGRKMYLHHRKEDVDNEHWKTHQKNEKDNLKQKVRIRPLRKALTFYFHIDFENLNRYELGLLCYALDPDTEFLHKIGMGKPLGLGAVKIEPVGIFCIDRKQRYQEHDIFHASRYHTAWLSDDVTFDTLPDCYTMERACSELDTKMKSTGKLKEVKKWFTEEADRDILDAIEWLGNPDNIREPVHYPQLAGRNDAAMEKELFKWFGKNEQKSTEYLKPLAGKGSNKSDKQTLQRFTGN